MALTPGPFFPNDLIGTQDTLTLQSADPKVPTQATIANAYYGLDAGGNPVSAAVSTDALSVSFTVIAGINPLIVNFISPDPKNELIELVQAAPAFIAAELVVRNHTASATVLIQGLAPAPTTVPTP